MDGAPPPSGWRGTALRRARFFEAAGLEEPLGRERQPLDALVRSARAEAVGKRHVNVGVDRVAIGEGIHDAAPHEAPDGGVEHVLELVDEMKERDVALL